MKTLAEYARRFIGLSQTPLYCSACGRPKSVDRRLISGPSFYVCEPCVRETADLAPVANAHGLCSFCAHPDNPVVRSWPEFNICADCLDLAQEIFDE